MYDVEPSPLLNRKTLSARHILALALIALLSLLSYWSIRTLITTQERVAAVVNLCGRQRMLSQRIAVFAQRYVDAQTEGERALLGGELEHMAGIMRASHDILLNGSEEMRIPPTTSPAIRRLLFEPPGALDPDLHTFWSNVQALLAAPPQARHDRLNALFVSGDDSLLQRLDAFVHYIQEDSETKTAHLHRLELITMASLLAVLAAEWLFIFRPMAARIMDDRKKLEQANVRLRELAVTDKLTGCFNRLMFEEVVGRELALSKRHGDPLSVLMLDIDHFKRVNDNHGHEVGDAVLVHLAKSVQRLLRQSDYFIRWGGEEFFVLLPRTGVEEALIVAGKIRAAVEWESFPSGLSLTVSIGVGEWLEEEPVNALLSRVDEALYAAKKLGRNRVQLAAAQTLRT